MTEQTDPDTMIPPSRLTFDGPKGPLFKALAEARKHFLPLSTSAEADVQGTSKAGKAFNYKFSYCPLDVVLEALEPGLQKAGLAISQPFDGDNLYTIVAFEDSSMTVSCVLPAWASPQDLGSALTYLRRYQLKGLFGVADSEDDDGNQASGNQATVKRQPSAPRATGPNIPEELRKGVTSAAKDNDLAQAEFYALVLKQTGKEWKDCDETDARKVLGVLKGDK